jgi:dCTP deaminase
MSAVSPVPNSTSMSIKSDKWIRRMAAEHRMIEPFEPGQVRQAADGSKIVSYGTSSYGYDIRCAPEFKVFTNIYSTVVDPKNFDEKSFVDIYADVCVIPPNSFALARTLEYFRIPRNVLTICLGKSTYARCGIIVNVTPLEPEWEGYVTLEFSNTTPLPAKAARRCCSSRATRSARPATRTAAESTRANAASRFQRPDRAVIHSGRNGAASRVRFRRLACHDAGDHFGHVPRSENRRSLSRSAGVPARERHRRAGGAAAGRARQAGHTAGLRARDVRTGCGRAGRPTGLRPALRLRVPGARACVQRRNAARVGRRIVRGFRAQRLVASRRTAARGDQAPLRLVGHRLRQRAATAESEREHQGADEGDRLRDNKSRVLHGMDLL